MVWDYAITADGEALDDYCDRVVVVTEGMANREDSNFRIPGLEGEVTFPNKLWEAGNVILVSFLRYSDEDGVITHLDGSAGHVYDNLSAMKRIFGKNGLVDLRRTVPSFGQVRMDVELIQGPNEGSFPANQIWVLKAPKPFWRGLTAVTLTADAAAHIPDGDAPIDDMIVTFGGNGRVDIDGEWIEMVGTSGTTVVDCGARTIIKTGAPNDKFFNPFSDRWLRLQGGRANNVNFTGSVTSLSYFPKWHGAGS